MLDNTNIEWILEDKLRVTKQPDAHYLVESLTTPYRANITISYSPEGRMLFNGEDIDTEDFMGYVGLIDEVNDRYEATNNPAIIEASDF
jgi:hypothetical protein